MGSRIGRIRVESVLGEGGMGVVYVGHDETLERQVALKSIRAGHRLSAETKARFVREARVLSRLDHPNICKIHDFIEGEDRDYLVLELIRGRNLRDALGSGLEPAERLPIARQIADALVAAHAEGIVHRDLKPGNVMLTESGEVKVLDFGLARPGSASDSRGPPQGGPAPLADADPQTPTPLGEPADRTLTAPAPDRTQTLPAAPPQQATPVPDVRTALGTVMGTVTYMSPEQARGEPVTTASDMYSFGLLLQTLFTGRGPYPADAGREEVFRRALAADTLPVTGLDAHLTRLIQSLKSPAPAARPTALDTAARLRWIADRPKRRVRWLAAALATAILVVGGVKYTFDLRRERTLAVEARQVADQRRGQAEDLIGFMLGDLREKLEPVGRLEILEGVGDKAMEYFASVSEDELSDDELLSRSKALYQIGEVRIAQGDLPAAEEPLRQSLALAEELSARDPSDGERLFGLGQSHFWVGYVHWFQGDLERALEQWQSYLEVSERLTEVDPSNLDWQLEVGYALSNLGTVYERSGQAQKALEVVARSEKIMREVAAADPSDLERTRAWAHSVSWYGSMLRSAGRLEEALAAFREESELRGRILESEPGDPMSAYMLTTTEGRLGELCLDMGDLRCGLAQLRQAVERVGAIVALDDSNLEWREELAVVRRLLGDALLEADRPAEAREHYLGAHGFLQELLVADGTNARWRLQLAKALLGLARARLALGEAGASSLVDSALANLENLPQDQVQTRRALAAAHLLAGVAEERSGLPQRAAASWRLALEVVGSNPPEHRDLRTLDLEVQALLLLGRDAEARPLVEEMMASGYARPGLMSLCRARGLSPSSTGTG